MQELGETEKSLNRFIRFFSGHSAGCGITDEVIQWMDRIQNSGIDEDPPPSPPLPPKEKYRKQKKFSDNDKVQFKSVENYEDKFSKYSKAANEDHVRHKRATRRDENKNTCSLYIQTDPLIWRHIREGFPEVRINFLWRNWGSFNDTIRTNCKFSAIDSRHIIFRLESSEKYCFCVVLC